ncbi:MAG: hypothetical protein M1834_008524 [Cirrosporium novae-zelandiae]|nr:MAG: hypothetical protein M1834_008524 [Cirrosporium novae-zelandiae]
MAQTPLTFPQNAIDLVDTDYGDSDVPPVNSRTIILREGRRKPQPQNPPPVLFHRIKHDNSILSLAACGDHIFAGTQGGEILDFSLETYELLHSVQAHRFSVLSLYVSEDGELLFSSAGDAIVNWVNLNPKGTRPCLGRHPSSRNHRFFDSKGPGGTVTPIPVDEKDAKLRTLGGQQLEISNQDILQYAHYGYVYCMVLAKGATKELFGSETLISGGGDGTIKIWTLDKDDKGRIHEQVTLEDGDDSVLALAADGSFLYSGRLGGRINIWDLETRQLIRNVKAHAADVLTLAMGDGLIFSGASSGAIRKFDQSFQCINRWAGHDGLILTSAFTSYNGRNLYISGGNDSCVAIWDVNECSHSSGKRLEATNEQLIASLAKFVSYRTVSSAPQYSEECRRGASYLRGLFKKFGASTQMLRTEGQLNPVVYASFNASSISGSKAKKILFYGHYDVVAAENERQKWITTPFTMEGRNGYLYGRGVSDNKGPILAALYAAMDLVSTQSLNCDIVFLIEGEEECGSRGFQKTIQENKAVIGDIDWILLANSYWLDDEVPCLTYGLRGVIHATIQVESDHPDLHSGVDGSSMLDESLKDLVMLLSALTGFHGKIKIPHFYDPILPLTEAEEARYTAITTALLQRNPGLGDEETLKQSLMRRWREASLTIHGFKVSGPENSTIIPRLATASLSIRLVPNQNTDEVAKNLIAYLEEQFEFLDSTNHLSIRIDHRAEPWLGDPENEIFRTLEDAVMEAWGPIGQGHRNVTSPIKSPTKEFFPLHQRRNSKVAPATSSTLTNGGDPLSPQSDPIDPAGQAQAQTRLTNSIVSDPNHSTIRKPLYIREGGSIPAIRFLEKEFGAPAAHLPCGQASDSAHLDNERLRISNLYKSREIFKKVFRDLPTRSG